MQIRTVRSGIWRPSSKNSGNFPPTCFNPFNSHWRCDEDGFLFLLSARADGVAVATSAISIMVFVVLAGVMTLTLPYLLNVQTVWSVFAKMQNGMKKPLEPLEGKGGFLALVNCLGNFVGHFLGVLTKAALNGLRQGAQQIDIFFFSLSTARENAVGHIN